MSSKKGKITTRYAPYIEDYHHSFLGEVSTYREAVSDPSESPYLSYNELSIEDAFLGVGYSLSDFPSLFDMFGKFMAGLDVDYEWRKLFGVDLGLGELEDLTKSEMALADDEVATDLMPVFLGNLRNINSVISSSFVIGKAQIEEKRIKLRQQLNNSLKYLTLPIVTKKWIAGLNFRKQLVISYAFIQKMFFISDMFMDRHNYKMTFKNSMWPFESLTYQQRALAAMKNLRATKRIQAGRSIVSKALLVLSYAVTGAVVGSYFGPYGTVIGGVVGFVIGIAAILLE